LGVRFRLPPLIRRSPSGLAYFAYWAPFIAIYQLVDRWHLFTPVTLHFTWLDRHVPFVPELVPVYVAYLPLYWLTVWRSENDREANRIFYAAYLQLLLSVPFFVLFPVRMPRGLFYAPSAYNWADAFWRWFDAPNNCFPSLHVSNCLLLLHFNWGRPHRWIFVGASVAVIASTLLVKQHYAIDVAAGALVYVASRAFLNRLQIVGCDDDGWLFRSALARRESFVLPNDQPSR
jgi:membrane-associated phospholipid phosphatase